MAKLYEFPQGDELKSLKKRITWERKKRLNESGCPDKTENKKPSSLVRYIKLSWFYLRLGIAGMLHMISVVTLAILGAFSKAIFWFGGLICVVTWFWLGHQFWTTSNFTIPVIGGIWVLSLLAVPLMDLMNKTMPWYRLLVPDAVSVQPDDEQA